MVGMLEESISDALKRIEAAARRIEAASEAKARPAADPELERKYTALKAETSAALADLDRLIGTLER
ncbi:ferritin-like metal-binding protein YciE [Altererythrobacter atlanticus]|uniref:Uncharacterized protein n=1 Tax=Croceibacterium atlanticum TaxID=1267766 RepID=A0A0F7KQJ3_9SPHN|nr:hypothetical protein [Croceibacterium atlanticum]AKH41417.1 hypothetical protein WYH_00355 [Croceibacterium atlanticum]MBB5732879.1 ferritin-like metal-binding protein YciE [Croceibacterium atlanticum]